METLENVIRKIPIEAFCIKHRIRKFSIFGSILRDDYTPQSDVDVLIEFEPGERVGFVRFTAVQEELSELFGRPVHLCTPAMISPYFRDDVFAERETLFIAA